MIIRKVNMEITLEEDVEKLESIMEELKKVKKMLRESEQYQVLKGKTQMMGKRIDKDIRSRCEHSERIAQIAKEVIEKIYDICATPEIKDTRMFELNKEVEKLYVEIVSLAHDLGHTPFGHSGEKSINEFMNKIQDKEEIKQILERKRECFGEEYEIEQGHVGEDVKLSFEHNEQSAMSFYHLAKNNGIDESKVDLKRIVRAILAHSTTRVRKCPNDLVAQLVRQTDKIEYRNADFEEVSKYVNVTGEDNVSYYKLTPEQKKCDIMQRLPYEAIAIGGISDNMESLKRLRALRKEYEDAIYFLYDGQKGLLTADNIERDRIIIKKLLEYYYAHPEEIPTKSYYSVQPLNSTKKAEAAVIYDNAGLPKYTKAEEVINYILSFDNEKAKRMYLKLVRSRILEGVGIEPITTEELEEMKEKQIQEKVQQVWAEEVMKSNQPHTLEEIRNIVIDLDKKFVETQLTEEGRMLIEINRAEIEKENELDRQLCEQMKIADAKRKSGIKVNISRDPEAGYRVATNIKKNWKPITEIPTVSDGNEER